MSPSATRSTSLRAHYAAHPVNPGPGLKRMQAAAKPGECPFCGDPIPPHPGVGRKFSHCQDPACWVAWFRCYGRDRRAALRQERA